MEATIELLHRSLASISLLLPVVVTDYGQPEELPRAIKLRNY
jgi:hypothetical protein